MMAALLLTQAQAVGLLVLSAAGFAVLAAFLYYTGRETAPIRRPFPYPGCQACEVAAANDATWLDPTAPPVASDLYWHQRRDHSGGPRWW